MCCVFGKWRLNKWLNLNLKKENSSLVTFEIADQNNLFLNIFCVNCSPRMSRECNHRKVHLNSNVKKNLSNGNLNLRLYVYLRSPLFRSLLEVVMDVTLLIQTYGRVYKPLIQV